MTQFEYNEAVQNHSDDLYRFVLKSLGNADDAKDVVQNAYEVLWTKKGEVENEKVKSYLFTVGYRKMIDELRKKKRTYLKDEIPEHLGGFTETKDIDLKKTIHQALESLSDIQKQLVLLKDYEGYSYEDLSKITGLNESQVKVYLYRARISLKKSLVSIERNI